jgi:hypothetical protein
MGNDPMVLRDHFNIARGYWEANESNDDLYISEIRQDITRGYLTRNTIFEDTHRAVLYQNV